MAYWRDTNLVPQTDLQVWYEVEKGATFNHIVYDASVYARHLTCAVSGAPVVTAKVWNDLPALYFSGSNPLQNSAVFPIKHIFAVCAFDGATFAGYEGFLTDLNTFNFLIGDAPGSVKFFPLDPGFAGYIYKKNNTTLASNNMLAPMGLKNIALLEIVLPVPNFINGIQIGQDRYLSDRKWKGWFFETLIYSAEKTGIEREKILLHFNNKFALHRNGLPFRFPSPDLTGILYSRFNNEPLPFEINTEYYDFDDGGRTFNEAGTPPRFWELEFSGLSPGEAVIFDEFWRSARLAHPFSFLDKYGETHQNVRIAEYTRNHDSHKSKIKNVRFRLVQYPL